MIENLLAWVFRLLLGLRYRVRVVGLDAILSRGGERLLFLPNHPALVDPLLIALALFRARPLFLADSQQIDRPLLRTLARRYGVRALPDAKEVGAAARAEIERALGDCVGHLEHGGNVTLYPSGHVYRQRIEDLRGNSAAHTLIERVPGIRVVAVRTTGLWGSSFSWASGAEPSVADALRRGIAGLLASGVFFMPRREVTIEFTEPAALAGPTSREELNATLEGFYNEGAPPALRVPYSVWDRRGAEELPEPVAAEGRRDASTVPPATRALVLAHLRDLTGVEPREDQDLARHLGLDSLARAELVTWLEKETGLALASSTALDTVADVLLAACGEVSSHLPRRLAPVPRAWQSPADPERAAPSAARTMPEAFLDLAAHGLGRPLVADQASGMRTVGDLLTGVFALRPLLTALPGEYLGVLLPASVGAALTVLATQLSGKVPVMVNFTLGARNLAAGLERVGVERVVTSRALIGRLGERGVDLANISDRFVYLEDLGANLTRLAKFRAFLASHFARGTLRRAGVSEQAVVLFTSGSEAEPKAVPLTHENILTNLRDITQAIHIRRDDCLLGILPPFHSFGFTVGLGGALCLGVRVAYSPDPTDAGLLAHLVEVYRVTALIGTPSFVGGIALAATPAQLAGVRFAVTGAEACPERVRTLLAERAPRAVVLEGYGITECSPVVSLDDATRPHPGSVGRLLPSVEHVLIDPDTGAKVAPGTRGMLLVRGPSIFRGYLDYVGPSPFVEHAGRSYYRTGDLVRQDVDGILWFEGRRQRFVKIGGEMISLPAIESALESAWPQANDGAPTGPRFAVVAGGGGDRPELVLITTVPLERARANELLREAGLSGLHSLRRAVTIDRLPLLGTGKVDLRRLERSLTDPAADGDR
ncbi:MAG: AMP-binding protein [Polyangiaceae bacterium]|nr:AMP-binding protein [Polyangiaceae bacterium]